MSIDPDSTTVVLGAAGKTGRRIVERLRARGVRVRAASRSGEPSFDWDDRATWAPTLRGAAAAYVSFFPDLAVPGAEASVRELCALAVQHGVRRLVLLSGRGEEEAQRAERAVQESGAEWTVVRCSWFMQNFSEAHFREPLLDGELALPVPAIGEPFVDAEDIADVAAAALTEDGHAGEVYELTGPRLLTFAEAVEEIAAATDRPLRFTPVALADFNAAMSAEGVPDVEIDLLTYLFAEVLDGRNAHTTDGVRRSLGREPTDFRDFARRAAAQGAWDAGDAPR